MGSIVIRSGSDRHGGQARLRPSIQTVFKIGDPGAHVDQRVMEVRLANERRPDNRL
jgi:hypothetical protein